jgi:hypothetical protein
LQPQLQLDPVAFCNSCCQLASQLGLQLPQLPGEALLLRATKDLGLPQVGLLLLLLLCGEVTSCNFSSACTVLPELNVCPLLTSTQDLWLFHIQHTP